MPGEWHGMWYSPKTAYAEPRVPANFVTHLNLKGALQRPCAGCGCTYDPAWKTVFYHLDATHNDWYCPRCRPTFREVPAK